MSKKTRNFAIGTVFAAIAGYIAGILTAPKSGKETRQDIKDATARSIAAAKRQLKTLHTELNDLIGKATDQVGVLRGKAREELEKLVAKAGNTKTKVREMLSAVHEGDAADKDLQKAITEAEQAIQHLKQFLKK